MQLAVLTSTDSWYLRDLQRAAAQRHDVTCCRFQQLAAGLGNADWPSIGLESNDLAAYDAILVRSMPPGSLEQVVFRMDVLARLEQSGTIVINPARALEVAIDKYLALARLADAGLMVPPTITCQSWPDAMEAFDRLGGDVVVKPIFGGEGRGITRVSDPALALRAFKMLEQHQAVIYLQKFVEHNGYDLRLLVIGDTILGMRRRNATDWRTNVSRGANTEPLEVDPTLSRLAHVAARAIGTPLAGVDLLPGRDGQLYALEVNAVPGWRAIGRTLNLDVADLILKYLERRLEM